MSTSSSKNAPPAPSPANDNKHGPIVILTPVGDGIALAKTLVRVLVRRELIKANAIRDSTHCTDERRAG